MKLVTALVLFFCTLSGFAQQKIIGRLAVGDSIVIKISRIGDVYGPYDQDTFIIRKTGNSVTFFSQKRNTSYCLDKKMLKTLKKMERDGLKQRWLSLRYDEYTVTSKTQKSTFNVAGSRLDKFMLKLRPCPEPRDL